MTTQECFMFDKMRQGHRLLLSSSKAAWLCGEMNADAHRSQGGEFDSCLERAKRNRPCLHTICSSFGWVTPVTLARWTETRLKHSLVNRRGCLFQGDDMASYSAAGKKKTKTLLGRCRCLKLRLWRCLESQVDVLWIKDPHQKTSRENVKRLRGLQHVWTCSCCRIKRLGSVRVTALHHATLLLIVFR